MRLYFDLAQDEKKIHQKRLESYRNVLEEQSNERVCVVFWMAGLF